MLHVLFDTSIYGKIFEDTNGLQLLERIKRDSNVVIHNFRLIRNELRKAPRVLPLYDRLVSHRVISEDHKITAVAKEYYAQYKQHGGAQGQKKILNDFKIVACASILGCDIVFSDDERTLEARRCEARVRSREHQGRLSHTIPPQLQRSQETILLTQ